MKTVWFTADTHFGHRNIPIYAQRLFCLDPKDRERVVSDSPAARQTWPLDWSCIAKMDQHIIDGINSRVAKNDILWHLGDFCWAKRKGLAEAARRYRDRINCSNVFLICGNHDSEEVRSVFEKCLPYHEIKVGNKHIVLSHYAHCFWNRSHYGSWMLYGHAHGSAEDWLDAHMPGRLSMDVGVDNIARLKGEYCPISSDQIAEIFSSRNGCQVDGHKPKPRAALHDAK